ncbi:unnamed protein product [Pleuronectes platessa]|uniref:Uncharacterized protein n=1 Tax=Pleuronectes platessa TaxID=8262 RepID=A0A9N7TV18_PLEPL|nr:unnamed protein product [Pleuronectes platessa]
MEQSATGRGRTRVVADEVEPCWGGSSNARHDGQGGLLRLSSRIQECRGGRPAGEHRCSEKEKKAIQRLRGTAMQRPPSNTCNNNSSSPTPHYRPLEHLQLYVPGGKFKLPSGETDRHMRDGHRHRRQRDKEELKAVLKELRKRIREGKNCYKFQRFLDGSENHLWPQES